MIKTISLGTFRSVGETIGRGLFFPIWWYSRGLVGVVHYAGYSIKNQFVNLGLGVWTKNLFVPMYGATDWAGRLISFFIRLVMIAARGLALLVWLILLIIMVAIYVALLPLTVAGLVFNFSGLLALF